MQRQRSSNSWNASNALTRRDLARKVMAALSRLPECFSLDARGSLLLGGLELAPERLGSDSAVGVVYKSVISDEATIFDVIATKIVPKNGGSAKELAVLQLLTNHAMNKSVLHFPIMYGYRECLQACTEPRCLRQMTTPYVAFFNELAAGDLAHFLATSPPPAACHSALMQSLISLMSLHAVGICHNDTHAGQLLFHTVTPRGSWSYTLGGRTFSVPNCGQLFVIWDFDQSGALGDTSEEQAYASMYDHARLLVSVLPRLPHPVAADFAGLLLTASNQDDTNMLEYRQWTADEYAAFTRAFLDLATKNLYVTDRAVNASPYNIASP